MRTYNKIVNAIDLLSASIIIFLLSFVWVKFYIRNLVTSLIIALIISISFTFITRKIYDKKNAKNTKSKTEIENIQKLENALILSSYEENLKFFNELFPESKIKKTYLIAPNNSIIIPKLDCLDFTSSDLLTILKDNTINKADSITIITSSVNKTCKEYASTLSLKINFLGIQDVYKLNNKPLESKITINPKNHNTLKMIAKMFIARKNVKGYIISSIFIIFSSLIVPYKTYYIISASILLILAFISIVINREEKLQQKKDAF